MDFTNGLALRKRLIATGIIKPGHDPGFTPYLGTFGPPTLTVTPSRWLHEVVSTKAPRFRGDR